MLGEYVHRSESTVKPDWVELVAQRLVLGNTVVRTEARRMVCGPSVDVVMYRDLPERNAEGSRLVFDTERGDARLWHVDADGRALSPLPRTERRFAEGKRVCKRQVARRAHGESLRCR